MCVCVVVGDGREEGGRFFVALSLAEAEVRHKKHHSCHGPPTLHTHRKQCPHHA